MFMPGMSTLRHATISLSALAILSLSAYGQPVAAPAPQSTTTTTTTTHLSAPAGLNTDTNSQPDGSATAGRSETDVRIRQGGGSLAAAMANFSVRTGLEIHSNANAQVVVRTVRPETPSARAGIEPGDIITQVDRHEIVTIDGFQKLILRWPSQPAFYLTLQRRDQSFRAPLGRQLTLMGMSVFPDRADRPVVVDLEPSSPAAFAGFRVGDVIRGFGHRMAATMDRLFDFGIPFIRGARAGEGLPFEVVREGKIVQLSVTRPADAELPPLTPEQERHLRHLETASDVEPPRHVISQTTTTMTRTIDPFGNVVVGATVPPVVPAMPPVVPGAVPGTVTQTVPFNAAVTQSTGTATVMGIDNLGLALPTGNAPGVGGPPPAAAFVPVQDASAAVAVLYGSPSNVLQQTLAPNLRSTTVATVTGTTPGLNAGVVGFVQIQMVVPPTGVNPPALGPNAPAAPPQSVVSARLTGIPAGNYTLAVHQCGDCGDAAGASPGPVAIALGNVVVDANGVGLLRPQTINHAPQAFLGRVVSLIPAGVLPPALPPGPPPATPQAGVAAEASLVACGVFGVSNPRRRLIADTIPADGVGFRGTTVPTGAPAPAPVFAPQSAAPPAASQPVP
jgi:hypothetical protein